MEAAVPDHDKQADKLATDDVPEGVDAPTADELKDAEQFFKDLDAKRS